MWGSAYFSRVQRVQRPTYTGFREVDDETVECVVGVGF